MDVVVYYNMEVVRALEVKFIKLRYRINKVKKLLAIVIVCVFAFNTMTFRENKVKAVEKNVVNKMHMQEKKSFTEEEIRKEKIKILDPDGTLGLEIVEEGEVKDGEYTIVTESYKVNSEKKNKILWERLKKYHKQLDMLEGGDTNEDAVVEKGTSEKVKE